MKRDLVTFSLIGKTMEALQHEHLEHEKWVKARPAARTLGHGANSVPDQRIEYLLIHQFAHAHQGRFKGCHVKILHKLIKESGVAKRYETCHAMMCRTFCLLATIYCYFVKILSYRECP